MIESCNNQSPIVPWIKETEFCTGPVVDLNLLAHEALCWFAPPILEGALSNPRLIDTKALTRGDIRRDEAS